jgi:TPR repeat protein
MKINIFYYFILILALLTMPACSESATQGTMDEAYKLYEAKKYTKAISIYRYLANEENNSKAMLNLGIFYQNGFGVKRDAQKAYDWFLKAANAGSFKAFPVLGAMNMNGTHEKDPDGNDMVWVRCHEALVTCDGRVIPASVWWYGKAVASGTKKSIKDLM